MLSLFFATEEALVSFAGDFAGVCPKTAVIFLYGNLGAGKTTFVRGFLRALGYEGLVKSPTYTIVEPYQFENFAVFHFDLYRIADSQELEYIGVQDYFVPQAICFVEWPENGIGFLPQPDLSCYIDIHLTGREFKVVAQTECGKAILQNLLK